MAFCSAGAAAETRVSILEAYLLAKSDDPSVAYAGYQVDGAGARKDEVIGSLLPQVSAFGSWSENSIEYGGAVGSLVPTQRYPGERYGLQFRQPLIKASAWLEVKRLDKLLQQSKEEQRVADVELLLRVTEAYFDVLLAEENLSTLGAEREALQAQKDQASAMSAVKVVPLTELLDAATRLAAVNADYVAANGNLRLAKERLAQYIGQAEPSLLPLRQSFLFHTELVTSSQAAADAVANNPEMNAAREAVEAARAGISRERGSWVPEVDLVLSHQYSDVGFDNLTAPPRTTESVAINVNFPLIKGGSGSARLRGAWAEFYGAQSQLNMLTREVDIAARSAWLNLDVASEQVEASKEAMLSSELSLKAATEAVRVGASSTTDVLVALAQNGNARRELFASRLQLALSWLELQLVVGLDPTASVAEFSNLIHQPHKSDRSK